ncbi:MAG: hypothetical protein AAF961_05075, partial [Planctomycetota bacterium]
MKWNNVRLIFVREMRDQLRDRRTLFLIAVLPLLLYPLLGMSFFQLSQFMRHHAAKVLVIGAEELDDIGWLPPLLDAKHFDLELFDVPDQQLNIELVWPEELVLDEHDGLLETPVDEGELAPADVGQAEASLAKRALESGAAEVVVVFPPNFGAGLRAARRAVMERDSSVDADVPKYEILYDSPNEKSQIAFLRVERVLQNWRQLVTQRNLSDSDVPVEATQPFQLQSTDVAEPQ